MLSSATRAVVIYCMAPWSHTMKSRLPLWDLYLWFPGALIPLRIYDAFLLSSQDRKQVAQIITATKISLAHESLPSVEATKRAANARLRFQLSAFHLDLNAPLPDDPLSSPVPLVFRWSVFGDDLPIALPRFEGSYVAFASSRFRQDLSLKPIPAPRDPLPEEIAPIPRARRALGHIASESPALLMAQVRDSITMAFFLPASTPTSAH